MPEKWKNIKGYDGYQISNQGRVRSKINNRHGLGKVYHDLKLTNNKHGYPTVALGRGNRFLVSRLVAKAFIPNPKNLPLVRHIDDNPSNNYVKNLKWGTQKDNMQDCVKHGRLVGNTGPAIEATKKPVVAISRDGSKKMIFSSQADAARALNVWAQHVSNVLKGRISQTGGWKFQYVDKEDRND